MKETTLIIKINQNEINLISNSFLKEIFQTAHCAMYHVCSLINVYACMQLIHRMNHWNCLVRKNGKIQFKIGTYLSHRIKQPISELWIRIFMEFCDKLHFFFKPGLPLFFVKRKTNKLMFIFSSKVFKNFVKIKNSYFPKKKVL